MATRTPLSRDRILTAALALASAEGLEGLTMRRLAKSLGVEAMSLYNHVSNKTDLLNGIAEQVFAEVPPTDPDLPWQQRVPAVARNVYRALRHHPVVPLALVTDQANPTSIHVLRPLDDIVGGLYQAGFDDAAVRQFFGAVTSLIFGSLLVATAGFARQPVSHPEREQADVYVRQVDPARLPHFSRLLSTVASADPEKDFQLALDLLMTGIVAASNPVAAAPPPPTPMPTPTPARRRRA